MPVAVAAVERHATDARPAARAALEAQGCVVVRGVACADDDALLEVVGWVATPSHHGNGGQVVFDVAPRPAAERRDLSTTAERFPLHTDSTFMPTPHAVIALGCVRASPDGGGASRLLAAEAVRAALAASGAAAALEEPAFPFLIEDPELGRVGRLLPVLGAPNAVPAIRFRDDVLEEVGRRGGIRLAPRHADALAALRRLLDDPAEQAEVLLGPGDVLLVDNHRMLHGRTEIAPEAERLLRRVKADRPAA